MRKEVAFSQADLFLNYFVETTKETLSAMCKMSSAPIAASIANRMFSLELIQVIVLSSMDKSCESSKYPSHPFTVTGTIETPSVSKLLAEP